MPVQSLPNSTRSRPALRFAKFRIRCSPKRGDCFATLAGRASRPSILCTASNAVTRRGKFAAQSFGLALGSLTRRGMFRLLSFLFRFSRSRILNEIPITSGRRQPGHEVDGAPHLGGDAQLLSIGSAGGPGLTAASARVLVFCLPSSNVTLFAVRSNVLETSHPAVGAGAYFGDASGRV